MRWWTRSFARVVAADPGMRRLRSAARVILGVVLALVAALPMITALGQPATACAPAAIVAMLSLLAVTETATRSQVITTLLMPVSASVAITLAALTAGSTPLGEVVFLGVMFAAVYARRWGPRPSALGMVAFIGYFLALFLRTTLSSVPAMAGAAVLGALVALVVRLVLLRERPEKFWTSGVRALQARVRTLLHAMDDLIRRPDAPRRRRRVQDELLRLNATALALETDLEAITALPEDRADELRRRILDIEIAAGALVPALDAVLAQPFPVLPRLGDALRNGPEGVAEAARDVADRRESDGSPATAMAVRRFASAAAELAEAARPLRLGTLPAPDDSDEDDAQDEHEVEEDDDEGDGRRLLPTTRTAVQVVCAAAVSIVVGDLVAPGQWFWAVITAFVVFAGTASSGELLVKAGWRTVGTLFGVIAGVLVAVTVDGILALQVAIVLIFLFLAFYVLKVSYGLMTFFVTSMLGVLYSLLGRFSIGYLEIRLVETVIGALAGAAAALLILPTRTRTVIADGAEEFCEAVTRLLRDAAEDLDDGSPVRPLGADGREVDDKMHALLASASPLGSFRLRSGRDRYQRWRLLVSSCAHHARELAVTLPFAADMSDADTRGRLAGLTRTLADLAEAIGARELGDVEELAARASEQEGDLVDLVEALRAGPTSLRRVVHQLGGLGGALVDLARLLGATVPATPAGRPGTPRVAPGAESAPHRR